MDLRTRYVVKGIGKEQTIDSKINIFYDKATGKITKVEDKWGGKLPDSSIQNVSIDQLFNPWWWLHYGEGWVFWGWSFTWNMWWWQVCVMPSIRRGDTWTDYERVWLTIISAGFPKDQRRDCAEDD